MRFKLIVLALPLFLACTRPSSTTESSNRAQVAPAPSSAGAAPKGPAPAGRGNVVGASGVAAWSALPPSEQDRVRQQPILYLHQSVGQDIEDGCEANGFKFEYFGPESTTLVNGPNGGIFNDVGQVPNGEPLKKMAVMRKAMDATNRSAKIASFSFGYADVRDEDLASVQAEYRKLVGDLKSRGARFVHVTPPLVYSVAENPPKQKMRAFMLATFPDDIIFDLQDVESLDNGRRCEQGGVWRICESIRSTPSCPSKSQGIDGEGAGHLCERKARDLAKALLYAYYLATR
jgi:hypothetical protein